MAGVNLKNVQSKRSNQENEKDSSHGPKNKASTILAQRGANFTRNERQRNEVTHHLLSNLVIPLDEEKRDIRSKARRGK